MKLPEYGDNVLIEWQKSGHKFVGIWTDPRDPDTNPSGTYSQFPFVVVDPTTEKNVRFISPTDHGGNPEITILDGDKGVDDETGYWHQGEFYEYGPNE